MNDKATWVIGTLIAAALFYLMSPPEPQNIDLRAFVETTYFKGEMK